MEYGIHLNGVIEDYRNPAFASPHIGEDPVLMSRPDNAYIHSILSSDFVFILKCLRTNFRGY